MGKGEELLNNMIEFLVEHGDGNAMLVEEDEKLHWEDFRVHFTFTTMTANIPEVM